MQALHKMRSFMYLFSDKDQVKDIYNYVNTSTKVLKVFLGLSWILALMHTHDSVDFFREGIVIHVTYMIHINICKHI
jgi:heme/copper-type cytochrome/quinol oxidase subunit 4